MGLTPSSTWQVQEAKSRFSELLDRAASEGPQTITRHGKPVARVVPLDASGNVAAPQSQTQTTDGEPESFYREGMSFAEFLLSIPKVEGFEIPPRSSSKAPVVFDGDTGDQP